MDETWHKRFLEMAYLVATWSKDPSTKVGAVAVGKRREVLATGYNGFPRGIQDDERYSDRELKYKLVVHAELNVCLHAARLGTPLEGSTLYITLSPCSTCAGALIQAGFKEVIIPLVKEPERWKEDFNLGRKILWEAGIEVRATEVSVPSSPSILQQAAQECAGFNQELAEALMRAAVIRS